MKTKRSRRKKTQALQSAPNLLRQEPSTTNTHKQTHHQIAITKHTAKKNKTLGNLTTDGSRPQRHVEDETFFYCKVRNF